MLTFSERDKKYKKQKKLPKVQRMKHSQMASGNGTVLAESLLAAIPDWMLAEASAGKEGLYLGEDLSGAFGKSRGRGRVRNGRVRTGSAPRRLAYLLAASFFGAVLCSIAVCGAAVSAGNYRAYELLHRVYPELADRLRPAGASDTSGGIRLTLNAVRVEGAEADVYLTLEDLTGNRVRGGFDLGTGYRFDPEPDPNGWEMAYTLLELDEARASATFLIQLRNLSGEPFSGEEFAFCIQEFYTGGEETTVSLEGIDLAQIPELSGEDLQSVTLRGRGRGAGYAGNGEASDAGALENGQNTDRGAELTGARSAKALIPRKEQTLPVFPGVSVTACAMVDGLLHVQLCYEDILRTDVRGELNLVPIHRDEDTADARILCLETYTFWDEASEPVREPGLQSEYSSSYTEYLFSIPPEVSLADYALAGTFHTAAQRTSGSWTVRFRLP